MGDVPECFKNGLPRTTYDGPPNMTPPNPEKVDREAAVLFYAHLRPAVREFALRMEEKLRRNDHKQDWKDCTIDCLRALLDGELRELDAALQNESGQAIAYEAADAANFLCMLADITGGLTSDHTILGARRS